MIEESFGYSDAEWGAASDIGNALRLIAKFEYDLRYVPSHGWYRHQSGHLEKIEGLPLDEATILPDLIRREALDCPDRDRADVLVKWAQTSSSKARLESALAIAADHPAIRTHHERLDSDPYELNTPVGCFDLKDGSVRPTLAKDLLTKETRAFPKAGAPVFEKFLAEMVPSVDVRNYLQRAVGYSLTGLTREEVFFILYGQGQNGKSKLLSAIAYALGSYAHTFDPKMIVQQKYEGHPTNIASLHGTRFAYSSEVDQGVQLDEGKVKSLTGGDRITARFMRKDEFSWTPTHKLWIATNHLPVIKGTDKGMWRRVIVIPFDVQVTDDQRDKHLEEKLHAEAQGILAWAIEGAFKYFQDGELKPPAEVVMASAHYQQEQDSTSQFLAECTAAEEGTVTGSTDLYLGFKRWCEDNGHAVTSNTAFGRELTRLGYESVTYNGGRKGRRGLRLLERSWV